MMHTPRFLARNDLVVYVDWEKVFDFKSSAWTLFLMPSGTCNDPLHVCFDAFKKVVGLEFLKVFKQLDVILSSQVNSKHGF